MDERMKPCGVCGIICSHLGARGNIIVCRACTNKATTIDGRPVTFDEWAEKRNDVLYLMGPDFFYKDPDPQAGQPAPEAWETGVWIEGIQVTPYEGVAGWTGFIVKSNP
jgi:hypothetical protein